MPEPASPNIDCPSCGKHYRWKPELAGRMVRCTCGHLMTMPQAEAPSVDSLELAEDGGYQLDMKAPTAPRYSAQSGKCPSCNQEISPGAVLCVKCGFNLQSGQPMQTAVDTGADKSAQPVAAPSHTGTSMAAVDALGGHRVPLRDESEEVYRKHIIIDYYLPVGMLVAGVIFSVLYVFWAHDPLDGHWLLQTALYLAFQFIVYIPVLLLSLLMAAKILDVTYGILQTAILKLGAIALGPLALADIILLAIFSYLPGGFGILIMARMSIAAAVYITLLGPFLSKLFDLDWWETWMTLVVMMMTRFMALGIFWWIVVPLIFA